MSAPHPPKLREIGQGHLAYFQPDGAWGLNNAGLIHDGEASLLVDTLFDLGRTGRMLDEMARMTGARNRPGVVVNTHANGDHCYGNQLLDGARIVASAAAAREMTELPPNKVALLQRMARLVTWLGPAGPTLASVFSRLGLGRAANFIDAAALVHDAFADFDLRGIRLCPPTETFDGTLSLTIGDKHVELVELGPAHTRGDVIVHVPADGVLYAGDLLFIDAHPVVWEGPLSGWIAACDAMEKLGAHTIVPGHGPLTDLHGVRRVRDYLRYLFDAAKARFDAGLDVEQAARDISFEDFRDWREAERVVVNVDCVYRELSGSMQRTDIVTLYAQMRRLRDDLRARGTP